MRIILVAVLLAIFGLGGQEGYLPAVAAQEASAPDYEGLEPGPGREAVYFTCTACHSLRQFTQQRMDREDWDATIERMVEKNGMEPPKPWARTLILSYLSTHFSTDTQDWGGLPAGPGREEVFYTCQACHSLRTVTQQKLYRWAWEDLLHWMVEEQGMPELEPDRFDRILNYLATYMSPEGQPPSP